MITLIVSFYLHEVYLLIAKLSDFKFLLEMDQKKWLND
jgi:hypothetical protein